MANGSDAMKSAIESASEREQRIKRRRDEAIAEVRMSAGQAATLVEISTRPKGWLGVGSPRRAAASTARNS